MGRGRAKAKQTKVARELKYRSVDTDFSSLEREMRGSSGTDHHDIEDDPYAEFSDKYADSDGDDDSWGARQSG